MQKRTTCRGTGREVQTRPEVRLELGARLRVAGASRGPCVAERGGGERDGWAEFILRIGFHAGLEDVRQQSAS